MNRLSLSYDAQLVKSKPEFDRLRLYPEAFKRVAGTDGWQDLLPVQLKRRSPRP